MICGAAVFKPRKRKINSKTSQLVWNGKSPLCGMQPASDCQSLCGSIHYFSHIQLVSFPWPPVKSSKLSNDPSFQFHFRYSLIWFVFVTSTTLHNWWIVFVLPEWSMSLGQRARSLLINNKSAVWQSLPKVHVPFCPCCVIGSCEKHIEILMRLLDW